MGTRVCSCVRVRSRSGADDARIRGICASATRSLRKAIHRCNTHIHSVCIHLACMYLYPCASGYTDERIADAGPPHTRAHVLRPCARACVRVCPTWEHTHPRRHMRARSVGVDRGLGLGLGLGHVLRPCARACVRVCPTWEHTHPRRHMRALFRRRRPRVARLAGVLLGVGVQRGHRRVEHRVGHHVVRGMRRLLYALYIRMDVPVCRYS